MVKFHRLAESAGFLDRITPKPLAQKVELVSVGNGRYEGTFKGVNVGGHYRIRVDFNWTDARTGKIVRLHTTERQAAVRPTANASSVQVTRDVRAGTAVVGVNLLDRYRNNPGPGHEGRFSVLVDGGTYVPVTDVNLTGDYTIRLTGLGPNDDPHVRIDFGGQTLRDDLLSNIGGGGGGGAGVGRNAVWFAIGTTIPHGNFRVANDSGVAINFGMERRFTPATALEGTLGFHAFVGKNGAPDIDVTQIAATGKWYLVQSAVRPFVAVGVGAYVFDPGSTRFGVQVGGGIQGDVAPNWSLEGRYFYHRLASNSPNSAYSTLQFGVRYGF
jgi:opacity protein-like surface antigen